MIESRRPGALVPRTLALAMGAVLSLALLGWSVWPRPEAAVQAGAEAGVDIDDHPSVLDDNGRFTGPGQVWPPQPKGATGIVARDLDDLSAESPRDRLARVEAQAGTALSSQAVEADDVVGDAAGDALGDVVGDALGGRHNLIAVDEAESSAQVIYYSLSNNQTVDLTITDGAVSSLAIHDPSDWQPELSVEEKQAAVDVARRFWQRQRDPRIDSLQGFSILAFQPNGSYYDTRMIYVSFHASQDARPELLTWVDLVTGEIHDSEVER